MITYHSIPLWLYSISHLDELCYPGQGAVRRDTTRDPSFVAPRLQRARCCAAWNCGMTGGTETGDIERIQVGSCFLKSKLEQVGVSDGWVEKSWGFVTFEGGGRIALLETKPRVLWTELLGTIFVAEKCCAKQSYDEKLASNPMQNHVIVGHFSREQSLLCVRYKNP